MTAPEVAVDWRARAEAAELALLEMTRDRNDWRLRARCAEPVGEDDGQRAVRLAEVERTGGR